MQGLYSVVVIKDQKNVSIPQANTTKELAERWAELYNGLNGNSYAVAVPQG